MRKMSKANNSEKKLKKLNSKLEQLELKRSRLLEWNRKRQEQQNPQAQFNILSPTSSSACVVMDASVLSGGNIVTDKIYVAHDSSFVKTWHVMNIGNAAWTDKVSYHSSKLNIKAPDHF
jgi:fructose-bisphosphate aldolase class 1